MTADVSREGVDTAALRRYAKTGHDVPFNEALTAMCDERDEARAALDRVRDLHWEKPAEFWTNGPWCNEDGEDWPCPTIQALAAAAPADAEDGGR